jgi:hypothetical protein
MNQSGNSWLEFVQFFHENNPELSYKQALQEASGPYNKMKKQSQQKRGGSLSFNNIDLKDPQMRFEAGVSALNSNLKCIDRAVIFGGQAEKPKKRKPSMNAQNWADLIEANKKMQEEEKKKKERK